MISLCPTGATMIATSNNTAIVFVKMMNFQSGLEVPAVSGFKGGTPLHAFSGTMVRASRHGQTELGQPTSTLTLCWRPVAVAVKARCWPWGKLQLCQPEHGSCMLAWSSEARRDSPNSGLPPLLTVMLQDGLHISRLLLLHTYWLQNRVAQTSLPVS